MQSPFTVEGHSPLSPAGPQRTPARQPWCPLLMTRPTSADPQEKLKRGFRAKGRYCGGGRRKSAPQAARGPPQNAGCSWICRLGDSKEGAVALQAKN